MPRNRSNQRHRTRKDLLRAAARLMKDGRRPTMGELADAAQVSRATAYRYFDSVEAVLAEAPVDEDAPTPEHVFDGMPSLLVEDRVAWAESVLHEMAWRNAPALRTMLAYSLKASLAARDASVPLRQNRRSALIEAALAPARDRFDDTTYEKLCAALALVFGTESMIALTDVLQLDEDVARSVKQWAVRALVRAALAEADRTNVSGR